MTVATLDIAERLKTEELQAVATDAVLKARWGEDAGDTSQSCCLTRAVDADAEAARQIVDLLGKPRAIDTVLVVGLHSELEGETVGVPYDGKLGLAGTRLMLVSRAAPDRATNTTLLQGHVLL